MIPSSINKKIIPSSISPSIEKIVSKKLLLFCFDEVSNDLLSSGSNSISFGNGMFFKSIGIPIDFFLFDEELLCFK
jgi:hypothetical protein